MKEDATSTFDGLLFGGGLVLIFGAAAFATTEAALVALVIVLALWSARANQTKGQS